MNIIYLFTITYFRGLFVYLFWRNHFLIILLSLEYITLSLYFGFIIFFNFNVMNIFFCIIYLTMAVCEGVLGLSIIVIFVRSVGNEFIIRLNSLW